MAKHDHNQDEHKQERREGENDEEQRFSVEPSAKTLQNRSGARKMSEQWLRDYALLALRIDRVMRTVTELPYVDGYYGPLLAPLLRGPERQSAFRRVLTEQLIPSDLR